MDIKIHELDLIIWKTQANEFDMLSYRVSIMQVGGCVVCYLLIFPITARVQNPVAFGNSFGPMK